MTITASRIQKSFLLLGLILVVWGTLLPWECYRGVAFVCVPGLGLYTLGIENIGGAQIVLIILTIATLFILLYAGKIFKSSNRRFGIAIVLGVLLFLGREIEIIIGAGGLDFVVAAMIILWMAYDPKWRATAVTIGFTCLLVIFATYNLLEAFVPASPLMHFGTPEWQGRLLLFIGSLWMFGAVLFGKYAPRQKSPDSAP